MTRPLILVGYRGTGKTTIGRLLAERMGRHFIDADAELEVRYGRTIREIFATEGEAGFREKESEIVADICLLENTVVATGGGVVLRESNRALLRGAGYVVWLSADPTTLWDRIKSDATTNDRRPALAGGGLEEVEELLHVREPLYKAVADLEISVATLSPELAVDAILGVWVSSGPKSSGSSSYS